MKTRSSSGQSGMKTRILLPLVEAGGETFFQKSKSKSKTKTETETKTNCCDAEEKEDEEGSGSCCTCARSATKFRPQQRTKNKNCDKITEKQAREKSTRKLYTTGKSAKSEGRNPHKIQRRKEGPPNK